MAYLPNVSKSPKTWTPAELVTEADKALNEFVDRRLTEPGTRYPEHVAARRQALARLFILLRPLDPTNPDPAVVQKILLDDRLQSALRYTAGPPISGDDLGVLVTRKTARLTQKAIKADQKLAADVLKLICSVVDGSRFPWLKDRRTPTQAELRHAIEATAVVHAAQTMATERRSYGRMVEKQLRERLEVMGYKQNPQPKANKVNSPIELPRPRTFYGEVSLYGRRADLLIGLEDGRTIAVEAKDSSSVVNSVKRVLNDTAAKAKHWHTKMGEQVLPVALLSGVFGVDSLQAAQAAGLYLVWAHDLDSFATWLSAQ